MYITLTSLVLASSSPRRREMLSRLGLEFKIVGSDVDETVNLPVSPELAAQELARRKALAVVARFEPSEDHWFLGVDTVVVLDGRILGKPADRAQAEEFLQGLSGRWHEVVSGYCLIHPPTRRQALRSVSSRALFKTLGPDEIAAYLETDEPWDKAGAYAVQGIAGYMVERLDGSFTNVVGLPLTELVEDMRRLGIIAPRRKR